MAVLDQSNSSSVKSVGRGNPNQQLLNWFDFKSNSDCLLIDDKDSSLEKLLANRCKNVDSVASGSKRLTSLKKKFDYIVCVSGETLVDSSLLMNLKGALKANGVLILGINNRFGIRYWNGSSDIDGVPPYNSIQDSRYKKTSSLAKPEIEELLGVSGFNKTRFYYPMPGLESPGDIFSDDYLPQLRRLLSPHSAGFGYQDKQLFSNTLALRSVIKSGEFKNFANAFLIFAEVKK